MSDWWPASLAHIPAEDPWADERVKVAEIQSFEDGSHTGLRITVSALVSVLELPRVRKNLASLGHKVSTSGPHPFPGDEPFMPAFWIEGYGLLDKRYEPLVLSWQSHDRTVLLPDAGFLMTYGLSPRNVGEIVYWDDPEVPARDVVTVISPSTYSFPRATSASVCILKTYLQDYLSLRERALVQSFWEQRFSPVTHELEEKLAGKEVVDLDTPTRRLRLFRLPDKDGIVLTEASGARVLALPGLLPITEDNEQSDALIWPGIPNPVDHRRAMAMGMEFVFVHDKVLGDYEGRAEFEIHPESGSVSFGTQWAVSHCERVKRDLIRLELKKLYEGVRPSTTRNWHKFAVSPPRETAYEDLTAEKNVAKRAKALTYALVGMAEALSDFALAHGVANQGSTSFIDGLDRRDLDYRGWWKFPDAEVVARHIPLNMTMDAFLDRCLALNKLVAEGLIERSLRSIVQATGAPESHTEKFRSLKLLDLVVCLCQVAHSSGLRFGTGSTEVWARFATDGTTPAQPIASIFTIQDMRILKAHKSGDRDRLASCLSRFNIEINQTAAGFGLALDHVYDTLISEIETAATKIKTALRPS
ncbi:MAG TPA: hypothetical protein VG328_09285 [Stellaceae bacterium]|nr:hypothetical protein [Stellaceae bacterium]